MKFTEQQRVLDNDSDAGSAYSSERSTHEQRVVPPNHFDVLPRKNTIRAVETMSTVPHDAWVLSSDFVKRFQNDMGLHHDDSQLEEHLEEQTRHFVDRIRCVAGRACEPRRSAFSPRSSFTEMHAGTTLSMTLPPMHKVFRKRILAFLRDTITLPLSPQATIRLAWDMVGLLLVLHDAITIPLLLTVVLQNSFSPPMDIGTVVYWSTDIVLWFLTATYVKGELKVEFKEIAWRYVKTWLVPDMLVVLPEWVALVMDSSSPALRAIRALRALRLVRLAKMESVLQNQLKRINSLMLLNCIRLAQWLLCLLLLIHWLACGWYWIGKSSGHGWFEQAFADADNHDIVLHGYLMALHWSIANFHGEINIHPETVPERIYAVNVLFSGMIISSVFVSVITDMILQLRQARKRRNEQKQRLRGYFLRHKISAELMVGVKRYFEFHTEVEREWVEDTELLQALPVQLQKSIHLEARAPTVEGHRLFAWMSLEQPTAFRDACHAGFVTSHTHAGHCLFSYADACHQMWFVDSGMLRYIKKQEGPRATGIRPLHSVRTSHMIREVSRLRVGTEVVKKDWICEPALWVQDWQNRGDLLAISDSSLLALETTRFAKVVSTFPAAWFEVALYVRWALREVQNMANLEIMGDLWDSRVGCTSEDSP